MSGVTQHCMQNSTVGSRLTEWVWTEAWPFSIIPNADTLPPSCDLASYTYYDRTVYTVDRERCISMCQAVIDNGITTNEPARYGQKIPLRKCGHTEDGTLDPDKQGEEEYVLSRPLITAITDGLYGPEGVSPRAG